MVNDSVLEVDSIVNAKTDAICTDAFMSTRSAYAASLISSSVISKQSSCLTFNSLTLHNDLLVDFLTFCSRFEYLSPASSALYLDCRCRCRSCCPLTLYLLLEFEVWYRLLQQFLLLEAVSGATVEVRDQHVAFRTIATVAQLDTSGRENVSASSIFVRTNQGLEFTTLMNIARRSYQL